MTHNSIHCALLKCHGSNEENFSMTSQCEIALLPATGAVAHVHAGELTARPLVDASLAQIEALDPNLQAFITVRVDAARREAGEMDKRYAKGERLPLHGLPLAVKDDIDTAGTKTTYGAEEYRDNVPTQDVGYLKKPKAAGAIIVGKASTSAFAACMNTRSVYSGTTLNPWLPENSSGGSSGGDVNSPLTPMPAYQDPVRIDAKRLRIAWTEDLGGRFPVDKDVRDVMRRARPAIEGLGFPIEDAPRR